MDVGALISWGLRRETKGPAVPSPVSPLSDLPGDKERARLCWLNDSTIS